MSAPTPGWYVDPGATETQRYWDGEQWLGAPIPAGAEPPAEVPVASPPPVLAPPLPGAATRPGAAARTDVADRAILPGTSGPRAPGASPVPGAAPGGRRRFGASLPPVPPGHIRVPGSTATIAVDQARLAPLGLRLVARLVDTIAVFVLCVVVNGYFYLQVYQEMLPQTENYRLGDPLPTLTPEANRLSIVILVITVLLWFAYEVPATANSGQTLGKRLVGIRVARATDDSSLSFGQSIRRWLIIALPSPPVSSFCGLPLQLVDLLWCTLDRTGRQCIHDKAVLSLVVVAPRTPAAATSPSGPVPGGGTSDAPSAGGPAPGEGTPEPPAPSAPGQGAVPGTTPGGAAPPVGTPGTTPADPMSAVDPPAATPPGPPADPTRPVAAPPPAPPVE